MASTLVAMASNLIAIHPGSDGLQPKSFCFFGGLEIPTPYLYKTGGDLSKCKLHFSMFLWGGGGGLRNVAYI